MKVRTFVRRATKTVLWASLFPWIWALGFGVAACGTAVLGAWSPGWLIAWAVITGIVAAVGTAGILYKPFDKEG